MTWAGKMTDGVWLQTVSVLNRLGNLLRCPLCQQIPAHPCSLKDCYHHFCRLCIVTALDGKKSSVCPECSLPVWAKDIRNNRQLENLMTYVDGIAKLTGSAPFLRMNCNRPVNAEKVSSAPSNAKEEVSRKESQHHCVTDSPASATNMEPVNSANSCNTKLFGCQKTPRRRCSPLDTVVPTNKNFAFSPLVAKMKGFIKLSQEAKRQRLESAGSKPLRRKRCRSSSDSARHNSKRIHQLTLDAITPLNTTVQKGRFMEHHDSTKTPVPVAPATAKNMKRNIRGETPLHIAAIKGDLSGVEQLLEQGADPNAKDNAGWTALHECCNHGHTKIVPLLLEYGALINVPGFENDTPLHDAVANSHLEVAALLLASGADTCLRNCSGVTAANFAVSTEMKKLFDCSLDSEHPSGMHISSSTIKIPVAHVSSLHRASSRVVILGTGLKGHHKALVKEAASLLEAQIVTSFSMEVSHIVAVCDKANCCSRTFKFLCGIATGKWIVNMKWISKCLQQKCLVDEAPFEVKGVAVGESVLLTDGPRNARENALRKAPGLFDGCEFFLDGNFKESGASKGETSALITLSGGVVLSRAPKQHRHVFPYHVKLTSGCLNTFIVSDCQQSVLKVPASGVVSVSWILDCLSHFKILNIL